MRGHFRELEKNNHPNYHLQSSWNIYGRENFIFEILILCEERFLASEEHHWCNMLLTHDDRFGYNERPTNPYGKPLASIETRQKISKANLGRKYNFSKEHIEYLTQRCKNMKLTEEQLKRRNLNLSKPVICLRPNGIFIKQFNSAKDASIELGIDFKLISLNCTKKCNSVKGYIFMFEKEYDSTKNNVNYKMHKRCTIMYDKNMNLIKEFATIRDASKFVNGAECMIARAIRDNKFYRDYIWKEKKN